MRVMIEKTDGTVYNKLKTVTDMECIFYNYVCKAIGKSIT